MNKERQSAICALCNIPLANEQSRLSHVLGKKHQLALHHEHMVEVKEKNGIFVSGLPNLIQHEEVLSRFSNYGKITDHYFGDGNRFAIIQFSSPEPVEELLGSSVSIRGKKLHIKRRIIKDKKTDQKQAQQFDENFEEINESLKDITDFQTQVIMLIRQVQPNWLEMVQKYNALCRDLQNILHETFPDCIVRPFGSTVTGLGFTTSDVDIYVEVFKVNETDSSSIPPQLSQATIFINKSKKLLQKCGRIFSQIRAIPRAKTPIIKCVHNPTKISCDFNFKNMLGVCNSSLISYYLSLDSKLKSLMIILKYWAKVHDLSGSSGRFSNYALIMLLIFYLEQPPYLLPSVISLQALQTCINLQEGWNGGFVPQTNIVSEALINQSIPELLHGFFEYYSSFDYALNVICPYLGHTVSKTDFLKPELLPDVFDRYKTNIIEQPPLRVDCSVCVQDPFELNHSITGSVPARLLEEFVGFCKLGADIFKNRPVDGTALYRLFTDETESIDYKKYVGSDTECWFRIPMGNRLLYLDNEIMSVSGNIPMDSNEKQVKMRKSWYNVVNQFIVMILTNILKFKVDVEKEGPDNKSQRLTGQTDVHDTNVIDSVCFHCTGVYNLWDLRKSISKDINVEGPLTLLEKQTNITNYICDVLYKGLTLNDVIIEVNITMQAKINPTEMAFHVVRINSKKGCFKNFAVFFAKQMPFWFEKYITELDKSVQSDGEAEVVEETQPE